MKRFSDTARFDDPWLQSLPLEMKLAWEYVWAKCDNAGVWVRNEALADFQIGKKVNWAAFVSASDGRLLEVGKSKLAIVGFVAFQCGELNPECRPHAAVITLLKSHGLFDEDTLSIEYSKGINTLQDKDKDQDKEKDQDQDTPASGEKKATHKAPAQSDDEWLAGLQTVLAYEHLNVAAEYSRAKVWCETNRRQCTRKFFTNWLNRASANTREIAPSRPVAPKPTAPKETPEEAYHRVNYTERVAAGLPPL